MAFTKILCATDFSAGGSQAMRVAVRLANEDDAQLVLAHSWYVPSATLADFAFSWNAVQDWSDCAEAALERARRDALELGARRVATRPMDGVPWVAITSALEADPAFDLVVVGTHGRTGLERVLLGSVAEQVVRHAPCSVLVTRGTGEPRPFTHVLCPIDFSAQSLHAVELAAQLVRPGGAGLVLLHVHEPPVAYPSEAVVPRLDRELAREATERLDQVAAKLRVAAGVPVVTRTLIGRAGADALRVLDDERTFDLVVMGSHGRTGIRRMLLGSVAEKVVRHAPCSVLVARPR